MSEQLRQAEEKKEEETRKRDNVIITLQEKVQIIHMSLAWHTAKYAYSGQ